MGTVTFGRHARNLELSAESDCPLASNGGVRTGTVTFGRHAWNLELSGGK